MNDDANLPAWMTPGEVLAWIAFRIPMPWKRWNNLPVGAPWTRRWGVRAEDLMHLARALQARATRIPWRPVGEPAKPYRATLRTRARILEIETGVTAAALAAEVLADDDRIRSADRRVEAARAELLEVLRSGSLIAFGRAAPHISEWSFGGISALSKAVFERPDVGVFPADDDDRDPTEGGWIGSDNPLGGFVRVRFEGATVLALWPVASAKHAQDGEADCNVWMRRYATSYVQQHEKAPGRDKEAVAAAREAGFSVAVARRAYAQLPSHLKKAARNAGGEQR